jgi:uncharacterized membrane protein YphA (DoxX/SURF4 family)
MDLNIFVDPVRNPLLLGIAAIIIRVFVGALMIIHGYPKLFGPSRKMMRDNMKQLGIPGFLFDIAGLLEFIGGIALIFGFLTRIAALLFAIEMIGTTIINITKLYNAPIPRGYIEPMFKATKGYIGGWELDTVILAASIAILIIGPGIFSIDYMIF